MRLPLLLPLLFTAACTGRPDDDGDDDETVDDVDVPVGATAIVAIVNPVVNEGHVGDTPTMLGSTRDGLAVEADPGTASVTADDGVAVVETEPGSATLTVAGAELALDVEEAGDVYDAAIAWSDDDAAFFANTPIRYPVGTERAGVVLFDPEDAVVDIEAALEEDDAVVILTPGVYAGDLEIRGTGALLYGEGFSGGEVTIDGSIDARGGNVRVRGMMIEGGLSANGNDFGISFSTVRGDTSITGNGGAFLRNVFCGATTVPSDDATLLDNEGLAPLDVPPSDVCE